MLKQTSVLIITGAAGRTKQLILQLARCLIISTYFFVFGFNQIINLMDVFTIQDTFRGRVCECPIVNGVQFKGDGYSSCVGM